MSDALNEAKILNKLRNRPTKGPVKLSYAEADWLIDLIEHPPLNTLAKRVLMDQAARKRLNHPGVVVDIDQRAPKPPPPVIDVPIHQPPPAQRPQSGWRGNPLCEGNG